MEITQLEIENKSGSAIRLTGQQLLDNAFATELEIKPTHGTIKGITDARICMVRIVSKGSIFKEAVSLVGKKGNMLPPEKLLSNDSVQKTICDIPFPFPDIFNEGLKLSEFEIAINQKARIVLTFFPSFDQSENPLDFLKEENSIEGVFRTIPNEHVFYETENLLPYQIDAKNTTEKYKKLSLFGESKSLLTANYCSDIGVDVEPTQPNITYLEILRESSIYPFYCPLITIYVDSEDSKLFETGIIEINHQNGKGQSYTIPKILKAFANENREDKKKLEVPLMMWIDGRTWFEIKLPPNCNANFNFTVSKQVSLNKIIESLGLKNETDDYLPTTQRKPKS